MFSSIAAKLNPDLTVCHIVKCQPLPGYCFLTITPLHQAKNPGTILLLLLGASRPRMLSSAELPVYIRFSLSLARITLDNDNNVTTTSSLHECHMSSRLLQFCQDNNSFAVTLCHRDTHTAYHTDIELQYFITIL